MINLRVLSTAAAMALVLPMVAPTASFAQPPHGVRGAAVGGVRAGGGAPVARFSGSPTVAGIGGGGGVYHGGYRRGGGGGGFIPGAVAGAVIGGAIASQSYAYYGGPGYYDAPGYYPGYDQQYYDDSAVAVVPAPAGDDAVAYCMQTYRSYDPQSGTYLGYDGYRHPCP